MIALQIATLVISLLCLAILVGAAAAGYKLWRKFSAVKDQITQRIALAQMLAQTQGGVPVNGQASADATHPSGRPGA